MREDHPVRAIAIDLGASSGRVILGTLTEGKLVLEEVHRFANGPVEILGRLSWDILFLYKEIIAGIRLAVGRSGAVLPRTLGIDTWGVDFGLLDEKGYLLQNPVCYRDRRTSGVAERIQSQTGASTLFSLTGVQDQFFNTSFQLVALENLEPGIAELADRLLFVPDLLNFFLTGIAKAERTIAGTSQLLEAGPSGRWSQAAFSALGLDRWPGKMAPLVEPGTPLGPILASLANREGLPPGLQVVAVASHDTASSILAVPKVEGAGSALFLNIGTWALIGIETDAPNLSPEAWRFGLTNEPVYGSRTSVLRNIMGMWLLTQCKHVWERESGPLAWDLLYAEAESAAPFQSWVDPDAADFIAPVSMPESVREFCLKTGQVPPEGRGAVLRCLLESLAFRFREVRDDLSTLGFPEIDRIHLMGGASRAPLLCQLTADACGLPVEAGPDEASATGNLMCQFLALGVLSSTDEARKIIRDTCRPVLYQPSQEALASLAFRRFQTILMRKDPRHD